MNVWGKNRESRGHTFKLYKQKVILTVVIINT